MSVGLGLGVAYAGLRTPTRVLYKLSTFALFLAIALVAVALVPGLGVESHGAMRWLRVGPVSFQPSEVAKVLAILYLAGFIDRHAEAVRVTTSGFLRPIAVLTILCVLLYVEPDYGAMVVLFATTLGMLFLGGVSMARFLAVGSLACAALGVLALMRPHSLARITNFMDPSANPLGGGFQLTQALIAFGRGEWFGVGLGASIQKLSYLPEAHTDFILAVIAEELGFVGVCFVVGVYALLAGRAFWLGLRCVEMRRHFAGYCAFGIGLWISLQSFVSIGVNLGLLPTKGLTLPLVSYGGNSMIAACAAFGLLFRIDREMRFPARSAARTRGRYGA